MTLKTEHIVDKKEPKDQGMTDPANPTVTKGIKPESGDAETKRARADYECGRQTAVGWNSRN